MCSLHLTRMQEKLLHHINKHTGFLQTNQTKRVVRKFFYIFTDSPLKYSPTLAPRMKYLQLFFPASQKLQQEIFHCGDAPYFPENIIRCFTRFF